MNKAYEECGRMYQTNDESLFTFMDNNRVIDRGNVQKIKESIKEYGFLNKPILVSKAFQVIDGQHRFIAWKEMDKRDRPKIKFIIETSDKDVNQLCRLTNLIAKPWKDIDFVRFYANSDIENSNDYQMILDLMEEYNNKDFKLNITFAVLLLANTDNSSMMKIVKEGDFRAKNSIERCRQIIDRMLRYKAVLDAKELSKEVFNHKTFRLALLRIFNLPEVDEKRLLSKINLVPLTRSATVQEYLKEIELRYNKGKRKDKIKFVKER